MKIFIFDLDDTIIDWNQYSDIFNNHNIPYSEITVDISIYNLLNNFKYPKFIYTNGIYDHAYQVLKNMKILKFFSGIYARDTLTFSKPNIESYLQVENNINIHVNNYIVSKKLDLNNITYFFFDDLLQNLQGAKNLNWKTIWIHSDYNTKDLYDFVDYAFPNIQTALMYFYLY